LGLFDLDVIYRGLGGGGGRDFRGKAGPGTKQEKAVKAEPGQDETAENGKRNGPRKFLPHAPHS
jgi:hypothetical protein